MNTWTLQFQPWQVLAGLAAVALGAFVAWKLFWWAISYWPNEKGWKDL
jgi:hypothetical protein